MTVTTDFLISLSDDDEKFSSSVYVDLASLRTFCGNSFRDMSIFYKNINVLACVVLSFVLFDSIFLHVKS